MVGSIFEKFEKRFPMDFTIWGGPSRDVLLNPVLLLLKTKLNFKKKLNFICLFLL